MPGVRPCDITSCACEGSVFAVRRGGRQQNCLGFPWQLEDIQLLRIPLLNSIQILWNPARFLAPPPFPSLRAPLLCPLSMRGAETRGFFEAALCVHLYVLSVCSAFVCCACTYSGSCFLCLKMRTRSFPTLANCNARCFILICHSVDPCIGVLPLISCC